MAGITAIASFFEGEKKGINDMEEFQSFTQEQKEYFTNAGISSFYVSNDGVTAFDLAKGAALKLLQDTGLAATEIDLVIYIRTRVPETFISSEAARLQFEIGASNAQVFSVSDLGCTDMSVAIKLAADHLDSNFKSENVLIVHGCKPAKMARFRYPVTVSGDGGLAVLVGRGDASQIIDFKLKTEGRYWNLFNMPYRNINDALYREVCTNERMYGFELAIESKMQFVEMTRQLLAENSLELKDIHHFILQNVSSRAYNFYETAMEIKISPVCLHNLADYGHLGPNDIMLNYQAGCVSGLFKPGEKIMILNNSPVACWSALLVQC